MSFLVKEHALVVYEVKPLALPFIQDHFIEPALIKSNHYKVVH